jgi:hypothetical protein
MSLVSKFRYRDLRAELVKLTQKSWHTYYVGNLSVARRYNQDAELVARLARGLQVAGLVHTCLKRNKEGLVEYRLYTIEKLGEEDLDAAMALTSKKGEGYVPPVDPEL